MRISDWSSDVCSSDLIHRAIVDFAAATVVTVIGIGKLAVLEIRREIVGLQHVAGAVLQSGASLHAIGAWHPAKKMIERAVLHHHHDDVIKARLFRIRQAVRAGRDAATAAAARSEEHTSELQSLMRISYADFCLKKKTTRKNTT